MKRFLGYLKSMPLKRKIKYCTMLISFAVALILMGVGNYFKALLPDVNAYKRWDAEGQYTQLSVYLPLSRMQDTMLYEGMLFQMNDALVKESIEPENKKSRMVVGAYSGYGNVTLRTDMATTTVEAIGVGGDFFYFHPLDMLDGSYLSEDYLMKDYIILDKETAWKLFGAINVTGMSVTIGDVPFLVAGVYEPTDIYLSEEAGLKENKVYMFYGSLERYGNVNGIQWLDFILPNAVKGYGERILTENSTVLLDDAVVMEQSTRFNAIPLYKLVPDYLERVMSKSGIVYPYWENVARGYENILVAFLLVETVCLVYGTVLLIHTLRPVKNIKKGINWLVAKIRGRK